jgi:hypothetical protein
MNLSWPFSSRVSGRYAVSGYLAVSRLPGFVRTLDRRTSLLAAEVAAQASECCWCIERCRHEVRQAGLSREQALTDREGTALAFVDAIARAEPGQLDELLLLRAQRHLSDAELSQLTAIVAEHHGLGSFDSTQADS